MKSHPTYEKGLRALARADFDEAIEMFSELVAEDGSHGEAWTQLGACYLETRQPRLALEALERAVKAAPECPMAHYMLGTAWGTCGDLERARDCYRQALALDPEHAKAEEFLVRTESLLASRDHFRKAVAFLRAPEGGALVLNQAIRELVQSVALFDQSPARDVLPECVQGIIAASSEQAIPFPASPELDFWAQACERGWQCVRFRNWVGARAAYEEALAYRWQDAFVHHAIGFACADAGEWDEAVRAWLRVTELEPDYDFTRFGHVEVQRPT
jgi:tetratricopeptide (TPR) repeat protein